MPAGILDFTGDLVIEAGSVFDQVITFKDQADVALDLTGYDTAMRAVFRTSDDAADPAVISLSKAAITGDEGLFPTDLANGQIRLVIDASTSGTASFSGGTPNTDDRTGVVQIEVENASGDVIRLSDGVYEISPEVAR